MTISMRTTALIIIVSASLCPGLAAFAVEGSPPAGSPGESHSAPAGPKSFPTGTVVDRVTCAADPERSYALYLPSAYTTDKRWPILVLMDPRGRALLPMALFREAAERHGYIVASSYDTRSDSGRPVNLQAMRALLPDVEMRFSLDKRRFYFAGFPTVDTDGRRDASPRRQERPGRLRRAGLLRPS